MTGGLTATVYGGVADEHAALVDLEAASRPLRRDAVDLLLALLRRVRPTLVPRLG